MSEKQFHAIFSIARNREHPETKWRIVQAHNETILANLLRAAPEVMCYKKTTILVTGIPSSQIASVLDVTEGLGGFLEMSKADLHAEIRRRLDDVLGMTDQW